MSQDANTILQGQLKQEKGLHTTRPQYTNILYGAVCQTDVSIAPLLPVGASSPIPTGMMTVSVAALGNNYVTPPILYPGGIAPSPGTQVAVGFTPNGNPICTTIYGGGSAIGIAQLGFSVYFGFFDGFTSTVGFPYDSVNFLPSEHDLIYTNPLASIDAGAWAMEFDNASVYGIDTTNAEFNLGVNILIRNLDWSELIILTGSIQTTGAGPYDNVTLYSTGLSISSSEGSDLAYDGTTGKVTSTAGGTYGAVVRVTGSWA